MGTGRSWGSLISVVRQLWEQSPVLDGEVEGGGSFQKGTQKVWFGHGLRSGYLFPPLGLDFGPDISLAANKAISLQTPSDSCTIWQDKHWRVNSDTWVRGPPLPLSH